MAIDLLQGIPIGGPDGQDLQKTPPNTGSGPSVELTVPLPTLLRLADEPGMWGSWSPLLADAARAAVQAMRKAPWRITATHPHDRRGGLVRIHPTPAHHRGPGLRAGQRQDLQDPALQPRQPIHCQIDHNVERQDGGADPRRATSVHCVPKHHRRKSRRLWDVKQTGDGRFEIHSPLGATYVVDPEPVDDHWDLPDDL